MSHYHYTVDILFRSSYNGYKCSNRIQRIHAAHGVCGLYGNLQRSKITITMQVHICLYVNVTLFQGFTKVCLDGMVRNYFITCPVCRATHPVPRSGTGGFPGNLAIPVCRMQVGSFEC